MLANSLRQMLRDLLSQKLRTLLTLFGIVWGTAAISLLMAFGAGYHYELVRSAAGLGNQIVIVWPSLTSRPFDGLGKGRRIQISEEDIHLVKRRAVGLGEISAEYQASLKLRLEARTLNVPITGVEPSFAALRNLIPAAGGRFINHHDHQRRRRVAFLGDRLSEQLFGTENPVGRTVQIHGSPFLVVGVMQAKNQNSNYSGPDNRRVYMPSSTFRALTGRKYISNFVFTATDVSLTDPVKDQVMQVLAKRHRFDPEDKEAMQMWDTTGMTRFLDDFMFAFQVFLGVVGSLTLVVGGIGMSNIMNVVVEERTREIGIKMALGARPRSVLRQLLLETAAITVAGGVLGLILAWALCALAPALEMTRMVGEPRMSVGVAAFSAALLGLIAAVAGYFPARTAARLDPVVAMKM
jgi:putative ABC transport system permease protein